jgi:hypothetical protein
MNGWRVVGFVVLVLLMTALGLLLWRVVTVYGQDTTEPKNLTNYLEMHWTSSAPMNENLWTLDELVCELVWAQTNTAWTVTTTTVPPTTTTVP